jgi:hypothetical protein
MSFTHSYIRKGLLDVENRVLVISLKPCLTSQFQSPD